MTVILFYQATGCLLDPWRIWKDLWKSSFSKSSDFVGFMAILFVMDYLFVGWLIWAFLLLLLFQICFSFSKLLLLGSLAWFIVIRISILRLVCFLVSLFQIQSICYFSLVIELKTVYMINIEILFLGWF